MRPIDAEEVKRAKFHPLPYPHITPSDVEVESYKRGWNDAIDAIADNEPTIDAVEVVRCKDCKYYEDGECQNGELPFSDYSDLSSAWLLSKPDDYCSYGEREEK